MENTNNVEKDLINEELNAVNNMVIDNNSESLSDQVNGTLNNDNSTLQQVDSPIVGGISSQNVEKSLAPEISNQDVAENEETTENHETVEVASAQESSVSDIDMPQESVIEEVESSEKVAINNNLNQINDSDDMSLKNADLISNPESVILGNNYRITVLTERLVRLEYNPNGIFYDNKTQLVSFRNFPKPEFELNQDDKYLVFVCQNTIYSIEKVACGQNYDRVVKLIKPASKNNKNNTIQFKR